MGFLMTWKGEKNPLTALISTKTKRYKDFENAEELQNKTKFTVTENTIANDYKSNYQTEISPKRIIKFGETTADKRT